MRYLWGHNGSLEEVAPLALAVPPAHKAPFSEVMWGQSQSGWLCQWNTVAVTNVMRAGHIAIYLAIHSRGTHQSNIRTNWAQNWVRQKSLHEFRITGTQLFTSFCNLEPLQYHQRCPLHDSLMGVCIQEQCLGGGWGLSIRLAMCKTINPTNGLRFAPYMSSLYSWS